MVFTPPAVHRFSLKVDSAGVLIDSVDSVSCTTNLGQNFRRRVVELCFSQLGSSSSLPAPLLLCVGLRAFLPLVATGRIPTGGPSMNQVMSRSPLCKTEKSDDGDLS